MGQGQGQERGQLQVDEAGRSVAVGTPKGGRLQKNSNGQETVLRYKGKGGDWRLSMDFEHAAQVRKRNGWVWPGSVVDTTGTAEVEARVARRGELSQPKQTKQTCRENERFVCMKDILVLYTFNTSLQQLLLILTVPSATTSRSQWRHSGNEKLESK